MRMIAFSISLLAGAVLFAGANSDESRTSGTLIILASIVLLMIEFFRDLFRDLMASRSKTETGRTSNEPPQRTSSASQPARDEGERT